MLAGHINMQPLSIALLGGKALASVKYRASLWSPLYLFQLEPIFRELRFEMDSLSWQFSERTAAWFGIWINPSLRPKPRLSTLWAPSIIRCRCRPTTSGGRAPPLSLGHNVMMTIDTTLAVFGRVQRRDDDAIFRLKKVVIGDAIDIQANEWSCQHNATEKMMMALSKMMMMTLSKMMMMMMHMMSLMMTMKTLSKMTMMTPKG